MDDNQMEQQLSLGSLKEHFKSLKIQVEVKYTQLGEFKHNLGVIREKEAHYMHEIDYLQTYKNPELDKLNSKIKQLQEQQLQLKEQFNVDMLNQDKEISRLQDELKGCRVDFATASTALSVPTDEFLEENLVLENELEILNEMACDKRERLGQLEENHIRLLETNNTLHSELERLKESTECKKQELIEAQDVLNNLEETVLMAKMELEGLQGKSMKATADENSLFAEVNERRLELKKTLLSLNSKCNQMKREVSKTQKQMSILMVLNDELATLLKNDPLECQQDYTNLIDIYRNRILVLQNLCNGYQTMLLQREELLQNGLPLNIMEFLDDINKKSRKMEEELNRSIGMEFRAQKMMSIQLKEINVAIHEWKMTIEELQNKIKNCQTTIQNLNLQYSRSASELQDENELKVPVMLHVEGGTEEEDRESVAECHKENIPRNVASESAKPSEKKVQFSVDTKVTSNHVIRRGGKVLQCKSIHISSVTKK